MSRLLAAQRALTAPGWVKEELSRKAQALPSLDLRFAESKSLTDAASGQSLVTFTRASSGTYVGSDGLLQRATTNLLLRSEEFDNASWSKFNATITANTTTAPNGLTTADSLIETATTTVHVAFQDAATSASSLYVYSVYLKANQRTRVQLILSDTGANLVSATINLTTGAVVGTTNGGTGSNAAAQIVSVGNGWYRCILSGIPASSGATVRSHCYLLNDAGSQNYLGDGTSGIYLWGAQLEQSSTVGEYIPTTSTINSAPRFDHNPTTGESLGLLVEEQRTNSIRNNTMVGAVAGTPGTLPTNWAATTPANGITREILGTGTEDGIAYIDFRFSGTNTLGSNYYMDISLDSGTIAAAQGQTWTQSVYVRLLAGVITGAAFSSPVNMVLYGAPGFNDNASGALASATNSRLAQQRFSVAKTYANAGTTGAAPRIGWTIVTGGTIDFTLRIGLPQLEQGAFATSVIPTSGTAATRNADVASITGANFSSWYRQDEGTVFTDVNSAPVNNVAQLTYDISEGAGNERMFQRRNASGIVAVAVLDNGVTQGDIGGVVISASARYRAGFAYKLNDLEIVVNGGGSATDTSATLPTPDRIHIGQNYASGQSCNGTVRRLTFWPARLASSTLSAITQ